MDVRPIKNRGDTEQSPEGKRALLALLTESVGNEKLKCQLWSIGCMGFNPTWDVIPNAENTSRFSRLNIQPNFN